MFDFQLLKKEMIAELENILQYWIEYGIDEQFGGFVGQRDHYNKRISRASKGAVLNARILWTFSAAYNFTKNKKYLEIAHRSYNYIIQYFIDRRNGGLYWELNEDGSVKNSRKQIYAQGFGVYGFSEYYKATGDKIALDHAIQLFQLIEGYSFDLQYGGYIEALSEEWTKLADMRLSAKDANEPKSMNTHLHILESYTNLYRVWPNQELETKIRRLIRTFLNHIIDSKTGHFNLFFDFNWNIKSNIVSYGHDIEGAWLLAEAAHELADSNLSHEVELMSLKMVDATISDGMVNDGSINYEKEDDHLDSDKHWWPQAETLVGLTYAWKISGKKHYLDTMTKTWDFIKSNIVDKENGEWFWYVDKNGKPKTDNDKAGFWKCPYHNSRALMEVINNLK